MIGLLHSASFRAMGTACTVSATALPSEALRARRALAAGRAEVEACERILTRFDPASDLSRMNRLAGEWVEVDARLALALRVAVRARAATGGKFDPTILPALVAAGYDRTFEELEERPARVHHGWRAAGEIEVDLDACLVRVERGTMVDLGGIGKGFSASRALLAMCEAWPELPGALVDLGGDVAVWGQPPERSPWLIAVADPLRPEAALGLLEVEDGAVATSGRSARRFGPGRTLHHLIDPRTGAPAVAGPVSVTVVAHDAAWAEAHATALAISEPSEARAHVAAHAGISALLVTDDGALEPLGRLRLAPVPCRAVR
jgi:FAD:protein FMN transferase